MQEDTQKILKRLSFGAFATSGTLLVCIGNNYLNDGLWRGTFLIFIAMFIYYGAIKEVV